MEHSFSGGERRHDEAIDPEELGVLLDRLHEVDEVPEGPDHHATVAAVCEATGQSFNRVWEVLEQIRREDMEARLSQRLREMEEPLYRVERPGFDRDPLSRHTASGRERTFNSLLDKLPKPGEENKVPPKSKHGAVHERVSWWIAYAVLVLLAVACLAVAAVGVVRR